MSIQFEKDQDLTRPSVTEFKIVWGGIVGVYVVQAAFWVWIGWLFLGAL